MDTETELREQAEVMVDVLVLRKGFPSFLVTRHKQMLYVMMKLRTGWKYNFDLEGWTRRSR